MTSDEVHEYWIPAKAMFRKTNRDSFEASTELAKVLGLEYPEYQYWQHIELTDELKVKLRALASPHRVALLKVMQIRQEANK